MKRYRIPKGTNVYPLNEKFMPLAMFESKEAWYFDETDIVKLDYATGLYVVVKLNQPVLLEEQKEFAYAFAVATTIVKEVKDDAK